MLKRRRLNKKNVCVYNFYYLKFNSIIISYSCMRNADLRFVGTYGNVILEARFLYWDFSVTPFTE